MKTVHIAILICLIVGIFNFHSVSADGKLGVYFFQFLFKVLLGFILFCENINRTTIQNLKKILNKK